MSAEDFALFENAFDQGRGGAFISGCCEVSSVAGQHRVDLIKDGFDESSQEGCRAFPVAFSCSSAKTNFDVRSMATKR